MLAVEELFPKYFMSLCSKFSMPHRPAAEDTSVKPGFHAVVDSFDVVKLPVSAIAGLRGPDAENFEEYRDEKDKVRPSTHCWTPNGDIIVGCTTGELLKVWCAKCAFIRVGLVPPPTFDGMPHPWGPDPGTTPPVSVL